jgi:hypothetical protein
MTDAESKRAPFPGPAPRAVSLLGLLLAAGFAITGCSQEGRTIQAANLVQGIAWDVQQRSFTIQRNDTTTTADDDTSWIFDLVVKVQIGVRNGCDAEKSALQLSLEGPSSSPLFVVTPVAIYHADDKCNVGANGDTVLTVVVNNIPVVNAGFQSFAVRGDIPVQIDFQADARTAAFHDSTTTYIVRVEDKDTGAPLTGAIVRVERFDTSELIGETTTDATGVATVVESLGAACSSSSDPPLSTPYVVKVSYSGRTMNLRMKVAPARCGVPERLVVRL